MRASFDQIDLFRPKNIFLHDIFDCWGVNHHERKNRFLNTAKQMDGRINIEKEVDLAVDCINDFATSSNDDCRVVVVSSNHDDALDRWLREEKIDNLGINAAYFHYLSYNKHKSVKKVSTGFSFEDAFQFTAKEKLKANYSKESFDKVTFLGRDVSCAILDVEFGYHGDVGVNGSRGSALGLSKIGIKTTIGHSHSPCVVDGCYQVGVNALIPLGYAKGASSWLHTNCLQYPNGKRTLINSINGEYYL